MSLAPGGRLGPYEIVGRLGAGGMGEVWRARDTRLERQVAIKVLPADLSANAQFKLRLEREARLISQLNHPNICTLHDIGHDDSGDFLVMEYVEGETLAERLTRGKLPLEQVVRYGVEIAAALDRAHKQGIVHRDLKPSNVMLTKSGVKLLDFGLAKTTNRVFSEASLTALATQKKDHALTAEGAILGTFQYMAPEQLDGGDADARTDIFALGCVLYEMVTGGRAFEGKTRTSLIAAIVGSTPRPISESEPLTPPALEHIVRKCLEKDPEQRWQSAHDIADELRWIAESPQIAPSSARRSRLPLLPWVLVALLAVALAALAIRDRNRASDRPMLVRFGVLPPPGVSWTAYNSFALSPDGRYLVFFGSEKGYPGGRLYLRKMDTLEVEPLPGTEEGSFPFWSPDSRFLGFFTPGKLKKMAIAGGLPQTLSTAVTPDGAIGGGGASWNQNGQIIFSPPGAIHKVEASGGAAVPVLDLDTSARETTQRFPTFLPNGRHFIYQSDRQGEGRSIYVASLDGPEPRRKLLNADAAIFAAPDLIVFLRESTVMVQKIDLRRLMMTGPVHPITEDVATNFGNTGYAAVSASRTGILVFRARSGQMRNRLAWIDRNGRELADAAAPGFYFDPAISPDGERLAVALADRQWLVRGGDIWIFDRARKTRSRLTFDSGGEYAPVWSPDGSKIAYAKSDNIITKMANGAGEDRILQKGAGIFPTDWSKDGTRIAYGINGVGSRRDIGVMHFDGDSIRSEIFLSTPFDEGEARFSPDGKWIAYQSDVSGRLEVIVETYPRTGGKWQISTGGGMHPRWRGDGGELYYLDPEARLMSATLTFEGSTLAASLPEPLFQAQISGPLVTWRHYDVTRDGRTFIFDLYPESTSTVPITVVQGWMEQLKE